MKDENDTLKDCLEKQIEEFDIISSIFCNPGELVIDDFSIIPVFHLYLSGDLSNPRDLCKTLNYRIYIRDEEDNKIEIRIELPHHYPNIELATVQMTSSTFNRNQERIINKQIRNFIKTKLDDNMAYIYEVVTWIQDNLESLKVECDGKQELKDGATNSTSILSFQRLWIYSHHIKSTTKRQNIIKNSKNLNLTGFSLPGKPGIICVEGSEDDTQAFWKLLKAMKWQKITVKVYENIPEMPESDLDKNRKFPNFKEIMFVEVQDDEKTDDQLEEVKISMSLFMRFLEQHNCSHIKKDLFGFE